MAEYPKLTAAIDGLKLTVNRPARTAKKGEVTHWREQDLILTVTEAEKLLADLPAAMERIQELRQQKRVYDLSTKQQEIDRLREETYGGTT